MINEIIWALYSPGGGGNPLPPASSTEIEDSPLQPAADPAAGNPIKALRENYEATKAKLGTTEGELNTFRKEREAIAKALNTEDLTAYIAGLNKPAGKSDETQNAEIKALTARIDAMQRTRDEALENEVTDKFITKVNDYMSASSVSEAEMQKMLKSADELGINIVGDKSVSLEDLSFLINRGAYDNKLRNEFLAEFERSGASGVRKSASGPKTKTGSMEDLVRDLKDKKLIK